MTGDNKFKHMKNSYKLRFVLLFAALFISLASSVFAAPELKLSDVSIDKQKDNRVTVTFSVINGEAPYNIIYRPEIKIIEEKDIIVLKDLDPHKEFWIFIVDEDGKYKHFYLDLTKPEL
jgi:hypothetical protein